MKMFYKIVKPFLTKSGLISQFNQLAESRKAKQIFGLNSSAKSLLLAQLLDTFKKNILFITNDNSIARNRYDDLEILIGQNKIHILPEYELLPYEEFSPQKSCQIERSNTLCKAISNEKSIFIVSIKEFLRNINNPDNYKSNIITLSKNKEYDLKKLVSDLIACGYNHTSQVSQIGEISKRGGILDIFSPQDKTPFRLEFFGDEIVSIREFSAKSQSSIRQLADDEIIVQPMREISLNNLTPSLQPEFITKIGENGFYDGIEQDFAKLLDRTATFSEYFNDKETFLIFDEFQNFANIEKNLFDEIKTNYEEKVDNVEKKLIPKPTQLFSNFNSINSDEFSVFYFNSANYNLSEISLQIPFESQMNFNSNFELLRSKIDSLLKKDFKIFIQSDNKSQSDRMQNILSEYSEKIRFNVGVFENGFIFSDAKIAIFTDHEIFNRYKQKRRIARFSLSEALRDYESLQNGDYVVHIDYGIGIYQGLEKIKVKESEMDCVAIRYADNDQIFVPTEQLNLISKFVGQDGIVPEIHRIGGRRWDSVKKKVRKDIEEIAKDLVYLYAQRKLARGFAFSEDSEWQKNLEASFIYEDTADQIKATEDIKNDMESAIPMERLICGDVGFGKTEVAIRAAFKSIMDSKQVAFLVPTTILAEQHFITFSERLKDYPVRVEMLSRFVTRKNQKRIIDGLQFGEIDIVIGTHRLLSKDVKFKNLGLIIIDEEQRFGVKQKEKLKALKANIDILLLSATPIPRTLNMALSKVKDMTIMNIPPENRLPIRTAIILYNDDIIELAVRREIDRQGQVFFLHNRVETIFAMKQKLCNQMPDISFEVAHAQMPERNLEKVMFDFYHHKFDVLICTTIIESGIDIPNVNTIIINRADKFGLAQLYQLRGRVGRSDHQAYAYLIIPEKISESAKKRIKTIEYNEALGSGLSIAMRDLEIRGAGNILGAKQHGLMNTIGINFYNQILQKAVERIRKGEDEDIFSQKGGYFGEIDKRSTKIQCEIPYFFPENYIEDETIRMDFYRRLNNIKSEIEFTKLQSEMIDRFGKLPQSAKNVFNYYRTSFFAENKNLKSIFIGQRKIIVELLNSKISKNKIVALVKSINYEIYFNQRRNLRIIVKILHRKNSLDNKIDNTNEIFKTCENILKVL